MPCPRPRCLLKPDQVFVRLIAGIDVNHDVADIGKTAEDQIFNLIGDFM